MRSTYASDKQLPKAWILYATDPWRFLLLICIYIVVEVPPNARGAAPNLHLINAERISPQLSL
jgi:hypothetical protein